MVTDCLGWRPFLACSSRPRSYASVPVGSSDSGHGHVHALYLAAHSCIASRYRMHSMRKGASLHGLSVDSAPVPGAVIEGIPKPPVELSPPLWDTSSAVFPANKGNGDGLLLRRAQLRAAALSRQSGGDGGQSRSLPCNVVRSLPGGIAVEPHNVQDLGRGRWERTDTRGGSLSNSRYRVSLCELAQVSVCTCTTCTSEAGRVSSASHCTHLASCPDQMPCLCVSPA